MDEKTVFFQVDLVYYLSVGSQYMCILHFFFRQFDLLDNKLVIQQKRENKKSKFVK